MIREVGRHDHFIWIMRFLNGSLLIAAVWVNRSKPVEERFLLIPFPDDLHTAIRHRIRRAFNDFVPVPFLVLAQMPFSNRDTLVSSRCQVTGHRSLIRWQGHMQIFCTCVVRITSSQDAASTRAATTDGQESAIKSHPFCGKLIDVWSTNGRIAIATQISHAVIIGNEDQIIGPIRIRSFYRFSLTPWNGQIYRQGTKQPQHRKVIEHGKMKESITSPMQSKNGGCKYAVFSINHQEPIKQGSGHDIVTLTIWMVDL